MAPQKNNLTKSLGIALLLIAGVVAYSFRGSFSWNETPPDTKAAKPMANQFRYIDAAELHEKLLRREKILIIDIRPEKLYGEYHLKDAIQTAPESAASVADKADTTTEIVLVGSRGDSETLLRTAASIRETGRSFRILSGGSETWQNMSLPGISSGDPMSFTDQTKVKYVTPDEARSHFTGPRPPILLDVRPSGIYAQKKIEGSMNIPLDDLPRRHKELPSLSEIIVYGTTPMESFQAGVRLFDLGYYAVKTLDGGFDTLSR